MILLFPVFNNVLTISTETLAGALCNLSFVKELNDNEVFKNIVNEKNLDVVKITDFINKHYQFEAKDGELYYYQLEHNSRHFHINGYEDTLFITDEDIELTIDEELLNCIIPNFSIDTPLTGLLTILLAALFSENEDDAVFFDDCMTAKSCMLRSYDTNTEITIELPDVISNIEELFNSYFKIKQ